jgi:paraquat-inducible protein B
VKVVMVVAVMAVMVETVVMVKDQEVMAVMVAAMAEVKDQEVGDLSIEPHSNESGRWSQ